MELIDYFILNTTIKNAPRTKLGEMVTKKLPEGYLFTEEDRIWVDLVDSYVKKYTKGGILNAIGEAVDDFGVTLHCDPYELFIDSKTIKI